MKTAVYWHKKMIQLKSLGLWQRWLWGNTKTMNVILSNFIRPAVKKNAGHKIGYIIWSQQQQQQQNLGLKKKMRKKDKNVNRSCLWLWECERVEIIVLHSFHILYFFRIFCNEHTVYFPLQVSSFVLIKEREGKMAESYCKMPLIAKPILSSKNRKSMHLKVDETWVSAILAPPLGKP